MLSVLGNFIKADAKVVIYSEEAKYFMKNLQLAA